MFVIIVYDQCLGIIFHGSTLCIERKCLLYFSTNKRGWVILYRLTKFSPPLFSDNRIQQVKKRLAFCIILVPALLLAHLTMFYKFLFVPFKHAHTRNSSSNSSRSTKLKMEMRIVENGMCANARTFYISAHMYST